MKINNAGDPFMGYDVAHLRAQVRDNQVILVINYMLYWASINVVEPLIFDYFCIGSFIVLVAQSIRGLAK